MDPVGVFGGFLLLEKHVGKSGNGWCFCFGEMPVFEGQNDLNDLGIASLSQAKHTAEGKEFTDNWSVKDISDING